MRPRLLDRRTVLPWLTASVCLLIAASARTDDEERPQLPVEVYEWSVWVGSPSQTTLNGSRVYRNAMPGVVGTSRPKAEEKEEARRFPIAPISVIQLFGEPTKDLDFDVRVKKGTMLAHWPKGSDRGGRIQWFKSDVLAAAPADLPPAYLPEGHWLTKLRGVAPSLFVKNETHVERFLAYDTELAVSVPVKLRGGPEEYTLQNLTQHPLRDVAVVVPTDAGYRVGWIDELPAAVPENDEAKPKQDESKPPKSDREKADEVFQQAEADAEKKAEEPLKPLPAEGDANIRARVDQVLNRPVTVNVEKAPRKEVLDLVAGQARFRYELDEPALAKDKVDLGATMTLQAGGIAARDALSDVLAGAGLSYRVTEDGTLFITTSARLAAEADKKGVVLEGPPVTITLSQPLKAADPSYRELTRDSHARRLASQGLREEVLQTLLDRYAPTFFEPDEVLVLAHLSPAAIEDAVLLDVFPAPKKLVRTALVVAHGIDPRLQDRARELVQRLGDASPKARDEAETKLFELGSVAIPALEDALGDKDVEIAFRAERLLMKLNRQVP
jgi:hypothetical protein